MRIAIGSLQCESNTLCPIKVTKDQFVLAYGMDMIDHLEIREVIEETGVEIVPTLYAHALPGGPVKKEDYLEMARGIVDGIPAEGIDGVWLYLHGAMYVEGIGSGETWLLREIRKKIGYDIPISVGMDFHANNTDEFFTMVNVVCGFRTAPHRDRKETQQKSLRLLMHCVEKKLLPKPQYTRCYVAQPGNCVQTDKQPLCRLIAEADEMEKIPGVLCAQFFNGQPWVDADYMGPTMVITCEEDTVLAKQLADKLCKSFWDMRHEFKYEVITAEPEEAVDIAVKANEFPVFISDSGDNTTAGAAGDSVFMLDLLMKKQVKDALVIGVLDKPAVDACYAAEIGDTVSLEVGGTVTPDGLRIPITGKLTHRGDILSYMGLNAGRSATIELDGVTLVVTENRIAVTEPAIFESVGMDLNDYKIIVVKLGYLFPKLEAIAKNPVFAFTKGSSTERLEDMGLKNIVRPMYPLDDDFR